MTLIGYAALSQIYHELGIHTFLANRQRHSKEQYDANAIMKMLVYSQLLFPASKRSSYDGRERFLKKQITPWMILTAVFLF